MYLDGMSSHASELPFYTLATRYHSWSSSSVASMTPFDRRRRRASPFSITAAALSLLFIVAMWTQSPDVRVTRSTYDADWAAYAGGATGREATSWGESNDGVGDSDGDEERSEEMNDGRTGYAAVGVNDDDHLGVPEEDNSDVTSRSDAARRRAKKGVEQATAQTGDSKEGGFEDYGYGFDRDEVFPTVDDDLAEEGVPVHGRSGIRSGRSQDDDVRETRMEKGSDASDVFEDHRLRNVRIAFIGDSLTRYTYLGLAYFARHGRWPSDAEADLLEMPPRSNQSAWHSFHRRTSERLQPFERCDCYRNWENATLDWDQHVENRYYDDAERNVHLSYITKMGHFPMHGHWRNRKEVRDASAKHVLSADKIESYPTTWSAGTYEEAIRNHLSKMEPKYDVIVFNEGIWKDHGLLHPQLVLPALQQALVEADMIGVYRTTTVRRRERYPASDASRHGHDGIMCESLPLCLDVGWTGDLLDEEENFVDDNHFRYHVYNRINRQLLELLGVSADVKKSN